MDSFFDHLLIVLWMRVVHSVSPFMCFAAAFCILWLSQQLFHATMLGEWYLWFSQQPFHATHALVFFAVPPFSKIYLRTALKSPSSITTVALHDPKKLLATQTQNVQDTVRDHHPGICFRLLQGLLEGL